MAWQHTESYPIYIHQTDISGTVHYARYLDLLEQSRSDYFMQCGLKECQDSYKNGTGFIIQKVDIEYKSPLTVADKAIVHLGLQKRRGVRVNVSQEIRSEATGRIICEATTYMVFVALEKFRPCSIPKQLKEIIDAEASKSDVLAA